MKYFRHLGPIILAIGAVVLFLVFLLALMPVAGAAEAAAAASGHDRQWGQFGDWVLAMLALSTLVATVRTFFPSDKWATREKLADTEADVASLRAEISGLRTEISTQDSQRERDYREIQQLLVDMERRQTTAAEERTRNLQSLIFSLSAAVNQQEGKQQVFGTLTDFHRQKPTP
jgi:hypothetical protein